MAHIDYFFAVISPFTYIAGNRLEKIAKNAGATVIYKPVDIMQLFARTGGLPPKDRHISRQEYRLVDMERSAKMAGMPINLKPAFFPANGAPAAYAIIAAQEAGGGDLAALVHSFTRACWAEDRNVAEDDVIRDCLSAAGFDPKLADIVNPGAAETFAANLEEAVSRGVFGAPFYITDDGARFWGNDRLSHLEAHLAG